MTWDDLWDIMSGHTRCNVLIQCVNFICIPMLDIV